MDTMTPPPAGHNNPPLVDPDMMADISSRLDEFMKASTAIREAHKDAPIRDEVTASRVTDHVAGLRGLAKQIEKARVDAKRPYDEKAKAVQELFKPMLDRVERATKAMLDLSTDYLTWKRDQEAKRQAEERAAAEAARRAAEQATAAAAASGDLDAEAEAARLTEEAEKQAKEAERERKVNVGSATGAGRTISAVTVRSAVLKEPRAGSLAQLFLFYRDRPEVEELLLRLANADIRAKDVDESKIPGIEIKETVAAR